MGLSNEERFAKMCHGVKRIVKMAEKLEDNWQYGKLKNLASGLWYELLKNESDGMTWLTGTSLADDRMSLLSIPGAASEYHKEKNNKYLFLEYRETAKEMCTCVTLLQDNNQSAVMDIYLNTEWISYALCRYNDGFRKSFEDLNRAIRLIQGECFDLLSTNSIYSQAWMMHNIVDKLLTYDPNDLVNQWWMKHNLHHNMKVDQDFEKVFNLYKKIQFRELNLTQRIEITLEIAGNKYHYQHQHKELLDIIKDHNKKKDVEKIPIKEIEKLLLGIKEEKKQQSAYERSCDFTSNYVNHEGKVCNIHDRT